MARVSQTAKPSSTSTGTRPPGLTARTACLKLEVAENGSAPKRTMTSSNTMPACLSSTQGRMDQDE